jgi:PD-(D/E)XK endonuclease
MKDTAAIGSISEAKILARFVELRWEVLIAWRRSRRYDMVIEKEGRFYRVPCKTGRLSKDGSVITFNAYNVNGTSGVKKTYLGEVDYFAVYCPQNGKTYFIALDEKLGATSTDYRLRLLPTKNNQEKNIRLAADYEL